MIQVLPSNTFTAAKWIVNATNAAQGTHTSLTSAMVSASAGDAIVLIGTTTENFTIKPGVDIVAYPGEGLSPTATIIGNVTMSGAGKSTISGIQLQTNGANCVTVSGSAATVLNLTNCSINCSNNTGISFTSSSGSSEINIYDCYGNIGTTGIGFYSVASNGSLFINNTIVNNTGSSTTATTQAAGSVNWFNSTINGPLATTSTGNLGVYYSTVNTAALNVVGVTYAGTNVLNTNQFVVIQSGNGACVSVGTGCSLQMVFTRCDCTATNAISGAGTVNYNTISYTGTSNKINATTVQGGTIQGNVSQAPTAGYLGETIRSAVVFGSAVSLPSGTTGKNLTSISLTAGTWDVSLIAAIGTTATGNATLFGAGISTTSATLSGNYGDDTVQIQPPITATGSYDGTVPPYRLFLTATTTVYAVIAISSYTLGTYSAYGRISATRVG